MNFRCDVTTTDDGAARPVGQPIQFPFSTFQLVSDFIQAPIQATITTLVTGLGAGYTFVTSKAEEVVIEEVQYPFAQEETLLDLGNLFMIRSPFNPTNTKELKFGVDFTKINEVLATCTQDFFKPMIGTRAPFQVGVETTQMVTGVKEAAGSKEPEPMPTMQDMTAGCKVNFREKRERQRKEGRVVRPAAAFDIGAFLADFTTKCGPVLIAAAPAGIELVPTTDVALITSETKFTETLFEKPAVPIVYPQTVQFTKVEFTSLATIESDLIQASVESKTVKYGIYVAGYELQMSQFFEEQRLEKGFANVLVEYVWTLSGQSVSMGAVVKFFNVVTTTVVPVAGEVDFEVSILTAFTTGSIQELLLKAGGLGVVIVPAKDVAAIVVSVSTGEEVVEGPEDAVIPTEVVVERNRVVLSNLLMVSADMIYVEATTAAGETTAAATTAATGGLLVFGVDVSRFELEVGVFVRAGNLINEQFLLSSL